VSTPLGGGGTGAAFGGFPATGAATGFGTTAAAFGGTAFGATGGAFGGSASFSLASASSSFGSSFASPSSLPTTSFGQQSKLGVTFESSCAVKLSFFPPALPTLMGMS
jgi:hypothetical protein